MSLTLPPPPPKYDPSDQAQMRRALALEDKNNIKRGGDVEVAAGRLILVSPDGSRFTITITDAGVLEQTEL